MEVLFENEYDGHTTNYIEVYSKSAREANEMALCDVINLNKGKLVVD